MAKKAADKEEKMDDEEEIVEEVAEVTFVEGEAQAEEPTGEVTAEKEIKQQKKRRVTRIRKTKKEKENVVATAIRLAVESGKVEFGFKNAAKDALAGKAKALVFANKAPVRIFQTIEQYSKLSDIPIISFDGTPLELGSACGKPFNISVVSIYEEGASNILEIAKKKR